MPRATRPVTSRHRRDHGRARAAHAARGPGVPPAHPPPSPCPSSSSTGCARGPAVAVGGRPRRRAQRAGDHPPGAGGGPPPAARRHAGGRPDRQRVRRAGREPLPAGPPGPQPVVPRLGRRLARLAAGSPVHDQRGGRLRPGHRPAHRQRPPVQLPADRGDMEDPATRDLAEAFGAPVSIHSPLRDGSLRRRAGAGDPGRGLRGRRGQPVQRGGHRGRHRGRPAGAGPPGHATPGRRRPRRPRGRRRPATTFVRHTQWVRARRTGIRTSVNAGQRVARGETLGIIAGGGRRPGHHEGADRRGGHRPHHHPRPPGRRPVPPGRPRPGGQGTGRALPRDGRTPAPGRGGVPRPGAGRGQPGRGGEQALGPTGGEGRRGDHPDGRGPAGKGARPNRDFTRPAALGERLPGGGGSAGSSAGLRPRSWGP